eukprot:CAMPEP_0206458682 /NCGR_PEP_ID=MMETSP0324_2-20121206/23715_1 /ASSEMBLY_ACC=CAM_ASM_000836 /TAXON_ID=2866 /ORGANISM="Crypthecodinium cohnii, Strain Seligo" /LENGTH=468 /DNA_ID=CAMNT_0053930067 /DNA_START=70 /DNA_END=1476 /DNA_ORIENTATION=+
MAMNWRSKPPELSKHEMAFKLVVSSNAAGRIIGKGGSEISRIKQECGVDCHIWGPENVFPGTEGQVAVICGSRDGIEASLQAIFAKVADGGEFQGGDCTIAVIVSSNAVSGIIGSKGATISQLKQDTGCKIAADKEKHMGEQAVRVTGEMTAVVTALAALLPFVERSGDSMTFAKQEYHGAGKGDWASWGPSPGKGGGKWGVPALGGWGANADPWGSGSWAGDPSWGGKGKMSMYGAAGGCSSSSMSSWKGSPGKGKNYEGYGWGPEGWGASSKGKHEKGTKGSGYDDGTWGSHHHQQKGSGKGKGKMSKGSHPPAQGTKRTHAEMEADTTQADPDMTVLTAADRELMRQLSQPAGEEATNGEEAVNGKAAPHPEVSLEEVLASLETSESLPEVLEAESRIVFMVPSNRVGRILGKGGAVIKEIQKLTGTKMSIETGHNQESAVTTTGKLGDVHRAHRMAVARILAEY